MLVSGSSVRAINLSKEMGQQREREKEGGEREREREKGPEHKSYQDDMTRQCNLPGFHCRQGTIRQ